MSSASTTVSEKRDVGEDNNDNNVKILLPK